MKDNIFIINGKKINIGEIELDKDTLRVVEKNGKYSFYICVSYDWRGINELKVGEEGRWMYNEYILGENKESALVWPSYYVTRKITEDIICFDLKFETLDDEKNICYMNKRGCFDKPINYLEVKIYVNYKDAKDGKISYKF